MTNLQQGLSRSVLKVKFYRVRFQIYNFFFSFPLQYEPIFESDASKMYLNHIILYECHGSSPEMEIMSREYGQACPQPAVSRPVGCNSIVATWVRGSDVSLPHARASDEQL